MIAQHYKDMLGAKSVIRQLSEWSTARGKPKLATKMFLTTAGQSVRALPAAVHRRV